MHSSLDAPVFFTVSIVSCCSKYRTHLYNYRPLAGVFDWRTLTQCDPEPLLTMPDLFLALLILSIPDSTITLGLDHLLNLPSALVCL